VLRWSYRIAPRPYWKGHLKLSLVSCPIALYPAVDNSERVSFRQMNRSTGNGLRQQLVDTVTGEAVETYDKARGYEVARSNSLSSRTKSSRRRVRKPAANPPVLLLPPPRLCARRRRKGSEGSVRHCCSGVRRSLPSTPSARQNANCLRQAGYLVAAASVTSRRSILGSAASGMIDCERSRVRSDGEQDPASVKNPPRLRRIYL
jgi:hypothetical protein